MFVVPSISLSVLTVSALGASVDVKNSRTAEEIHWGRLAGVGWRGLANAA